MRKQREHGPLIVVAVLLLMGLGCRSAPHPLNDEHVVPPYAQILQRSSALERIPARVRVEDPGTTPLTMQVVSLRRGAPDADASRHGPLLVLLPGVLAGHQSWRFLAPLLAARHDVLLIDPVGAGSSDIPDPAMSPPPAYTPGWLGRHAFRAAARWQSKQGDTRPVVLIGHSLGSACILRALGEPATQQALPGFVARIERLVLMCPPDVRTTERAPALEEVATLHDAVADVGDALGILRTKVETTIWESVVDPSRHALRGEADRLHGILANGPKRRAAQAMLRRWRPMTNNGVPLPQAVQQIAAAESRMTKPTLILWGREDTTIAPHMGMAVARRLPDARFELVANARHSLHQEQAHVVAALVHWFLREAPRNQGGP